MWSESDFATLENRYYDAMFARRYERCEYQEEPRTSWHIDWESESGQCEDRETVIADTEEAAAEIFREEMVGENGIPDDAVVMSIEQVA